MNLECDMFYSFLGDINLLKGRWEDKVVDFIILINNIHKKDDEKEWQGFI